MNDPAHQLLLAIVQEVDAAAVCDGLITAGFPGPTRVPSIGGFLLQGNALLLMAVATEHTTEALRVIAGCSRTRSQYINPLPPFLEGAGPGGRYPMEVQVGAATVFILDIERFERW